MADLFVTCDSLGDETRELIDIYRLTWIRDYESFGDFARLRIGHAQDGAISHARMFEQHSLELGRSNAEALVLDHFLLAIDYVEIAVVIDPSDVSCIQPSVAQNTGGLFRCIPVSPHNLRTANDNFADFRGTQGDFAGLKVDNPML